MKALAKSLICLSLIVSMLVLPISCAKDIGPDNVQVLANTLHGLSEGIAEQGLPLVKQYVPEQLTFILDDLNSIIGISAGYTDGNVSVEDLRRTTVIVLNDLNARFSFMPAEYSGFVNLAINTLANLATLWFVETTAPEEVAVYVNAFSSGLQSGIAKFEATQIESEVRD